MITSAEEFVRLRTSEDADEQRRAAHDEAPAEVWHEVISGHPDMRFWVAQNKTVPVEILEKLAHDTSPDVRGMVARKRKLPHRLQNALALDPDQSVRHALATDSKVHHDVLDVLAKEDGFVGDAARKRLQLPEGEAG